MNNGSPPGSLPGPLVVSLVPRSLAGLAHALASRVHRGSDVVEVRLDHIAEESLRDPEALRRAFTSAGRPVIAAIHGSEGFGSFDGSPSDRREVLLAAKAAGAVYLDVDEALAESVGDPGGPRILSTHGVAPNFDALSEAAARAEGLRLHRSDLVKLVPACGSVLEGLSVLDWLAVRPRGSAIAFGSGDAARFTRMLAPAFGSALVYAGPFEGGADFDTFDLIPAAPGQVSVALMRRIWPHGGPGPDTSIAAVCGVPIDHSAGPVVHGAACRAAGIDGMLVPVAPEALADLWAFPRVRARLCGLSVTAPFKGDAVAAAAECDGATESMGAANTLLPTAAGTWAGRNTDAPAVAATFREAGAELTGATALVIGAGGAARAAAYALAEGGAEVTVAARRLEQAEALVQELGQALEAGVRAVQLDGSSYRAMRPDLIVHTTPLGTNGHGCPPVSATMVGPGSWTMDAVYRPKQTELLRRVAEWGGGVLTGDGWFLGQAWLQHRLIYQDLYRHAGLDLDAEADLADQVRGAMRAAFESWGGRATSIGAPAVIALVGLRGAGKSSVGRAVATAIGAPWLDLDDEVAKAAGARTAGEVIEREGLRRFRLRECDALALAIERAERDGARSGTPTVVSAGGGVVESERAVEMLDLSTFAVWLRAPVEVLVRRVAGDPSAPGPEGAARPKRPAIVPGAAAGSAEEFRALRDRRDPIFDRFADAALDVGDLSVEAAALEVCRSWNNAR